MTKCVDCRKTVSDETGDVENYIVHDEIWSAANMDRGCLCVECLEGRLGRSLTGDDLDPGLPVNYPGMMRDTPRLFQLKADAWGMSAEEASSDENLARLAEVLLGDHR